MKIKQYHWHHFFGGVALLLLIIQTLSGSVLTLFYIPQLTEAYASMQYLYNELGAVPGSGIRTAGPHYSDGCGNHAFHQKLLEKGLP